MKGINRLIPAAALLVLAFSREPPAEELYKWRDEDGQLHFSDHAPPGAAANNTEKLDVRSSSGRGEQETATSLRAGERRLLEAARQREDKILQARRRSVSKYRAEQSRCRAARDRYDRAKRKPGAADSHYVRNYHRKVMELCR